MNPAALELAQRFMNDGLTIHVFCGKQELQLDLSEQFLEALSYCEWQKTKRLIFGCLKFLLLWVGFWYFFVAASR